MTHFMNATLPTSTTLDLVRAEPPALPAGITELDAARITRAIAAAKSETTRGVYAQVWSHWERWCARRGTTTLPADPGGLPDRTRRGRQGDQHPRHVLHGDSTRAPDDRRHRPCRLRGGPAGPPWPGPHLRRRARPLTLVEIRQIVAGIDRTTPIGTRDAAIILLGYASALRRGELVGLTLTDVEHKPAGLLLHIRQSKTDRDGHGQQVAVAHGQHALTDPSPHSTPGARSAARTPGAVFTRIWASTVSLQPLSGHVVARMLRARADAAGLDGTRITGHSLRAGHATIAALAGVPLNRAAVQTRHKDLTVLVDRYIRPREALATTSSKDLACDPSGAARDDRPVDESRPISDIIAT
jgi:integrase